MPIQYVPPVTWVDDPVSMMQFARHVRDTGECAMDTETTGLRRDRDHVLFWSASPDVDTRYCFSREMLQIYDAELSQDADIKWYFTNQTFDFSMLENSGVRVPIGDTFCTLALDWLYDENRQGRHGLKETAYDHLGFNMREFKEAFKGKKKGETYQERLMRAMRDEFESATSYASLDALMTLRVFKYLKDQLSRQHSMDGMCLWDYFCEVEMPFTRVLHHLCRRGVMVDVGYLDELSPKIQIDIDELQKELNKIAGREVNPRSPKQLQVLLYDKLGLEPFKMTSGGTSGNRQPSTDEEVLTRFAEDGIEAAQLIMDIRGLSKMKGTYVDGLRKWVDGELRIHPTLTQHVAVTGRLSSVDPNLQNIPRPGTDKFGIRSAFMPKTDHILVVVDYAQLEMRLMAHYSGDPNMIDVINRGQDIHTGTAALMFGHKYDDIIAALKRKKIAAKDESASLTKLEKQMCFDRQAAKSIGFGQQLGRSKTHSKRGNLSARHTAIPCCASQRSVSTCGVRQGAPNEAPASNGLGGHSRKTSLTRWVKSIVFGVWQQNLFASIVGRGQNGPGATRSGALHAAEKTTYERARRDGTGHTRRRDTIRRARRTTIGREVGLLSTIRRSPTQLMVQTVYAAENLESSFTTRMRTAPTLIPTTWKSCASVAIRSRFTTVRRTSRNTLQRYSQCPGKPGMYTLNYGEGPQKLGKTLGVTKDEAKRLMAQYFEPYPKVEEFINGVHNYILDHAMVETIMGRPRRFHEMYAIGKMLDKMTRWDLPGTARSNLARAERQSVNAVIQGSAADVAKMAMIKCEFDERLQSLGVQQLLQVHDELMFEVPEEYAEEAMPIICDLMEHPFGDDLSVPLSVDGGMGYSWSSAKA